MIFIPGDSGNITNVVIEYHLVGTEGDGGVDIAEESHPIK